MAAVGTGAHVEYLAQIVINCLFVSRGHRADTRLVLVMGQGGPYAKALALDGGALGDMAGLTETGILETLADALHEGRQLEKDGTVTTASGIAVSAISFEGLVRRRIEQGDVLLLDKKGDDLRAVQIADDVVCVLTDHVPLPRNVRKSLIRMGARPVSLGPVMLHASQCVVVVQNELDRRGVSGSS